MRVLSQKFGHREPVVRAQLEIMLENAIRVNISGSLSGICRDPNDDFILECATLGHADLIITGDKDLLTLATFESTRILTSRQYLDLAQPQHAR